MLPIFGLGMGEPFGRIINFASVEDIVQTAVDALGGEDRLIEAIEHCGGKANEASVTDHKSSGLILGNRSFREIGSLNIEQDRSIRMIYFAP
mmetsp:Transcript_3272/g.8487  ORF Transcript_3272/g.8487 Transcript_3272/m.8487 type:complete len:92 (-) Transcript_3272:67-342(-)